jgi:hypothetical protein
MVNRIENFDESDEEQHVDMQAYDSELVVACFDIAYHMCSYGSPLVHMLLDIDPDHLLEIQGCANKFMEHSLEEGDWEKYKEVVGERVLRNQQVLIKTMTKISQEGKGDNE